MIRSVLAALAVALCAAAAIPRDASANTIIHTSFSSVMFSSCTGEDFSVEGDVRFVSHGTLDGRGVVHAGGTLIVMWRGTAASGTRYVGMTQFAQHNNYPEELFFAVTLHVEAEHSHVIALGESSELDDRYFTAHLTFQRTDDGEVIIRSSGSETGCR